MAYKNLPGIFETKLDGNITLVPQNNNPIVMVIGTAEQGDSESIFRVANVNDAAKTFGKAGTLTRGLYETALGGALNIRLFRIGATPAILTGVGGVQADDGYTIETIGRDDSMGTDYKIFFDADVKRLYVLRASDGEIVYDNNPADPTNKIDLGEVSVSGSLSGSPTVDIGTAATLTGSLTLSDAGDGTQGEVGFEAVITEGTDGTALSRMELYEALDRAYSLLEDQEIDVVVPMNAYLDDLNVVDVRTDGQAALGLDAISDYPTPGAGDDALGLFYKEEFEGETYYWWWFPSDPTADRDTTFTADTGADIFPSVGAATALLKADGTALTGSDFHEVNFAYQLANFCYTQSRDNTEMTGVIGVLPPNSYGLKDVALWVGQLPTTEDDANGNIVIPSGGNGTGLLGNKWMSGRIGVTGQLSPHTIGGVAGLYNGGFIATDSGYVDGTQLYDANDHLIDIGKYISIGGSWPVLTNPSRPTSYSAPNAPTYGGFYSTLPANSAPTNKLIGGVTLPYRISVSKLDLLAGQRYVTFHAKTRGIVVSDAPTAARPDSDYQRLSTVRQVKAAVDDIRLAAEPFLGEGMTGTLMAGLETAIDTKLKALVKQGVLNRYDFQLTYTSQQRILGQATVELKLVPAFELRQLTVVVGLAAV